MQSRERKCTTGRKGTRSCDGTGEKTEARGTNGKGNGIKRVIEKNSNKKSIEGEEERRHGANNMERDYSTLYRKSVRTYIAFKRKGFSGSGSEKDCMKCQSWEQRDADKEKTLFQRASPTKL